jgi:hypothetical protein
MTVSRQAGPIGRAGITGFGTGFGFLVYGRRAEITWNPTGKGEGGGLMGNSQGRDNVKKRASRRKKTERLAAAKKETAKKATKK